MRLDHVGNPTGSGRGGRGQAVEAVEIVNVEEIEIRSSIQKVGEH